mgnify:CR=1 FL=1
MATAASSNQPVMAITNRWWEDGQFGGEPLWKTRTAYVGYEGGPRNVSFTFPNLPTSNITINNITVFIDADIEGAF